jgi:hypothetical protein
MRRHLPALPLLIFLLSLPAAANTLYKCTDSAGTVLYTNQQTSKRDCTVLSHMQGAPAASGTAAAGKVATASKPRAASTPTPGDFPRVSGNEQKARDTDRRAILEKELANEMQNLDKAKKTATEAGQPPEKLQPLRDTVALHERNITALKKELGNLR